MSDETTLLPCPFCSSEPDLLESYGGWYIRCSCGVSMCENYSEGGFPIGEFITEAEAIAAWNARATHGTLTAERVKRIHEIIEKHWHDLPDEYDMPEATALPEYSYDWQAIADELNAKLGSECDKWKAKAEEAGRAMNAAAGLWAKADAENRELQAKCDELNAKLGSGTCKQEERGWSTEGDHARVWLTCGHDCMVPTVADLPNFCPRCGAKVVKQ